jgi:O-antigen ligase
MAVAAQAGLALAMKSAPILGLIQAAGIVVLGLYAIGKRNLVLLACLCAYLTGCEVLWRQVRAPLFFLMAPYALIVLSAFVVAVVLGRIGRDARIAILYAALMLPSTVNTVRTAGEGSRELISFALTGPLALAAFVAFTSQVSATPRAYRRILWTALVSAVAPLTVAVSEIRTALAEEGAIEFSGQSNFLTSGGFGPVQVSTVLGLGVVIAVVLILLETQKVVKLLAAALALAFSVQSLLTFSRGGMFAAAIALSALAVVNARNRRIRNRIILIVGIALTVGYFAVVPWLSGFTGGAFGERFSDTESARTDLAANDLEIFIENPVFGVGPGMTKYQRLTYGVCKLRSDDCANEASSHTEFTRMLGEHGLAGLIAIGAFGLLAFRSVRSAARERPFAVAFVAWAVAQMFYANLRVVAVPFAFGLAFLTIAAPRTDAPA